MRYKLSISYDGSTFHGWQIQKNSSSVQDYIQDALSKLLNDKIVVTGAGRTDTEVNAIGYAAHFDTSAPDLEASDLVYKLNAILPSNIVIHEILPVNPEFHSRFDAINREYHYFIHRKKDPFVEKYSWRCGYPLDMEAMNKAASYLLGTKDFSCFEKKGGSNKTSICTVREAVWETYTPNHKKILGYPASDEDYIVFRIQADRFLRNMVRAIVGTLVDIGRGKKSPEWIKKLIADGNRSSAGESVPGRALFFSKVDYQPSYASTSSSPSKS